MKFEWESLCGFDERAKVIGGWIFRTYSGDAEAIVFIPDPKHEWEIDS